MTIYTYSILQEWVKDEEHSAITAQVLGVLKFLINYGYINNDYTIEVINCLLNLIKSTLGLLFYFLYSVLL